MIQSKEREEDCAEGFVRGYFGAKDRGPCLASDLMEALGYHWSNEVKTWCCSLGHPVHPSIEFNNLRLCNCLCFFFHQW